VLGIGYHAVSILEVQLRYLTLALEYPVGTFAALMLKT
jgi:hypothetical protein